MKKNKSILCIERFMELCGHADSIKDFLVEENIIDVGDFAIAPTISMKAETIFLALASALKTKKISLVDYEWALLPTEYIRITIVTENVLKEFSHGF